MQWPAPAACGQITVPQGVMSHTLRELAAGLTEGVPVSSSAAARGLLQPGGGAPGPGGGCQLGPLAAALPAAGACLVRCPQRQAACLHPGAVLGTQECQNSGSGLQQWRSKGLWCALCHSACLHVYISEAGVAQIMLWLLSCAWYSQCEDAHTMAQHELPAPQQHLHPTPTHVSCKGQRLL